jgi:NADP-dependent 3-hydroxy acid dehydrogenase YdfG
MKPSSAASKKVVLITGASSGLGKVIAEHLNDKGHIVYGVSRNIEESHDFKTQKMDVCNEGNVQYVISKIIEEEGKIDVVINSAGNVLLGPTECASTDNILNCFNTNILGSINTIKAALPYMRAQKSGLIINISSLAAANGLPYRGYYSASKAAIERLTESLRLELAPFDIQACYIEPGDFYGTNLDNNTVVIEDKNKVYNWQKTREWISQLIVKGKKPVQLARLIENIISAKKVKSRYKIGHLMEKLSASLRNILPDSLMEKMIKIYFKL